MPRYVTFGAILGEVLTEIFEFIRGREILRSKSREIAPKSDAFHVL